ncbi:hypothetical protein B0T10DRAFT_589703 [Thelonectria olida]|uniref:UspA domain-containing protein n=1 Tax=Thelonectria olida TaxID=1576542 RepID=A0A9P8W9M3_9HYPO|nr:hypothetical protein B0T10DRAFT_589703 [Thelonectria olida]
MSHNQPMSIEAMMDMERREVLALLENRPIAASNPSASPDRMRSASPYSIPRSPVRSMLDVDDPPPAASTSPRQRPVRSMLDTSSPPPPSVRSMLDLDSPVPGPSKAAGTSTTPNSPVSRKAEPVRAQGAPGSHIRSFSDASQNPVDFGPRASADPTAGYQFSGFLTHNAGGQHLPKRNTQGGKKKDNSGALAEALRTGDLSGLQIPGERRRLGANKSKSPDNRLSSRSRSPALTMTPGKAMLDDGQIVDLSNAYRRLSNTRLAYSGGTLSQLPTRKRDESAQGHGRLIKDYMGPDGEHLGSSEDDEPVSSDDEDRGRKKAPRSLNPDAKGESGDDAEGESSKKGTKVASERPVYKYRSLLDEPEIKVTNPAGDNVKPTKSSVHPNTSYDLPGSATASMIDSDEEADMDDIKRAQKLGFSMTNIMTSPEHHRAIRIIYRGEYAKIAQAAEDEHHTLRKYLCATDLSDESTHALEWAIGTVLRDGDTLLAIYCVDEEAGIYGDAALVPDDPKAMKEQALALNTVTNAKGQAPAMASVPDFVRSSLRGDSRSGTPNTSPAPSSRADRGKADEERRRAVKDITERVNRLLRKTSLQVRVIVEVLHCKNPKHLITEVIDLVNPTLVVIGSRGRSALKGVILGSFSNYLVTKSSVPVMVARKRLRKQGKYKRADIKQINNLSNPAAKSLANAKID